MRGMRIDLSTGTTAELARPEGAATRGVVLHPDIGGLRPLFDEMCDRLAREHGWAVCAPEPFPGRESMTLEERMAAVAGLDDETQLGHLAAAADVLGTARTAVLGFCMGGMYALKAAGSGRYDAAVAFYGMIRVPEQWQGPGHGEPLESVRRATQRGIPVLAIIGTADIWTPAADVDDLEAAGAEVVRYEGAEHGFVHDADRPAHRAADAADAWTRVTAFL